MAGGVNALIYTWPVIRTLSRYGWRHYYVRDGRFCLSWYQFHMLRKKFTCFSLFVGLCLSKVTLMFINCWRTDRNRWRCLVIKIYQYSIYNTILTSGGVLIQDKHVPIISLQWLDMWQRAGSSCVIHEILFQQQACRLDWTSPFVALLQLLSNFY